MYLLLMNTFGASLVTEGKSMLLKFYYSKNMIILLSHFCLSDTFFCRRGSVKAEVITSGVYVNEKNVKLMAGNCKCPLGSTYER